MENKNVSTTYVPLQPPYQIIKYGSQVGMQIGTLIATSQIEGDERNLFQIETHSYPVVTYKNKEAVNKEEHLGEQYFMEGVVWDHVQLAQVTTLCLSDSHLPWQEFIDLLWTDIWRRGYYSEPEVNLFHKLGEFGVKVDPIPPGNHVVHLQTYCGDERPTMVRTDRDDIIALNIELKEGYYQQMADNISMQIMRYNLSFVLPPENKPAGKWHLVFTTDEDVLKHLVELLNHPRKKIMFGGFKINAVQPYEDEV
ncbi:MAG: hypothetical protein J5671_09180 [Bacteroidaceae bacterium]|nr:hypothetical protein [Bacteroidaceae bacterium]